MKLLKKSLYLFFAILLVTALNSHSNIAFAESYSVVNDLEEPTSPNLVHTESIYKGNEMKETVTLSKLTMDKNEILTLTLPFNFKNGEYIEINKDENDNFVNSANIYNKEGTSIGIISFEKNNDIQLQSHGDDAIELKIKSDEQVLDITYLVASYNYEDYFHSSSWIERDSLISLSLNPKPLLWESGMLERTSIRNDSWQKVLDKHQEDSQFYNENGMKDQYYCHFDFAKGNKVPWNIEPSRPDVGYILTVLNACNP